MVDCIACGKAITEKDTIGINKKMLGENIRDYYCLDCLADYLECTTDELLLLWNLLCIANLHKSA